MMRSFAAILAGLITGVVVVIAGQAVGQTLFPLPPGVDPLNPESLQAAIDQISTGARISHLVTWGLASFAGGAVTARIATGSPVNHALIVGALPAGYWACATVAGTTNTLTLPHPSWMWIGAQVFLPFAYMGGLVFARRPH